MIDPAVRSKRSIAARLAMLLSLMLVLSFGGYMLFANLGVFHLVDYDEARHGVNAYEMIRNNDYLVHTYAGEPDYWNLKTPLSFWSVALSYGLFGYNAFALRFFSALSTLLSMTALTCWAWRRHGYLPALLASAVFVCSVGMYGNHFARFGDADSQYQLCFTLSMLCMLMSRKDFRWFYGSAACFVLAFMLKATHALLIPLICLMDLVLTGRLRELKWKRVLWLALIGLAPIAAWAVARYLRDGLTFFENMITVDVLDRLGSASTKAEELYKGVDGTLWYFISDVLPRITPLFVVLAILALCAAGCLIRRAKLSRECADTVIGASLWLLVPILAYSLVEARYLWYIFSAFAAFPALVAGMTRAVLDAGVKRAWVSVLACAAVAVLVITALPTCKRFSRMTKDEHSYQDMLANTLDREVDGGTHIYIQYSETKNGEPITTWMPADMLAALYAGDAVCIDGGAEAFVEDEESALLVIGKSDVNIDDIDEALGYAMPRDESYSVYVLEK